MDQKELKDLMRAFDKSGLSKMKLKDNDFEVVFEKSVKSDDKIVAASPQISTDQPSPIQQELALQTQDTKTKDSDDYIVSPMVGTFYQAPSPGAAPFVNIGDSIKKGSTVAIIEAMKIMNEIEAEFDCKIVEILVSDGEPVEFDQPLFRVKKL